MDTDGFTPAACHRHWPGFTSNNSAVAVAFAQSGLQSSPVAGQGPRAKQPLTVSGHHDATTDLEQVRRWWERQPCWLVGSQAGPVSEVWVLDVDGAVGRQSLNELLACLGLESVADLTGCISRTPSGGLHLVFRLQAGERPRK